MHLSYNKHLYQAKCGKRMNMHNILLSLLNTEYGYYNWNYCMLIKFPVQCDRSKFEMQSLPESFLHLQLNWFDGVAWRYTEGPTGERKPTVK